MNPRIKILHVVPDMGYGGVEKVVLNYYKHMKQNEYIFDFVSHGSSEEYHQDLIKQGSAIYYFKSIGQIGLNRYKKQIERQIDLNKYDLVHVHTGHLTGLYAKAFKCLNAKRVICHAHTTKCTNSKHHLLMPYFRMLARKNADLLLACGHEAGKFCFGSAESRVLPNGVDFNLYKDINADAINKIKQSFGIEEGTFIVGNVAHFSEQKNHLFIVKLIEEFCEMHSNAKFILVGDGPLKSEIENKVKDISKEDQVIFTGIRHDIPLLMKLFDVFILPSLFEGLPVVSIEAQAAGTPLLLSNTIDSALDINVGLATFIPISNGVGEWIEKLELAHATKLTHISEDIIHDALCKHGYDISSSADRLAEIYDMVIGD